MGKRKKFEIPEIKRTIYDCTLSFESKPHYVVFVEVVQKEFNDEDLKQRFGVR